MHINQNRYQQKKKDGMDACSLLREFESRQYEISQNDLELGLRAMRKALSAADEFERRHPRIESPERRRRFERITELAQDMADTFGLDFCARIDEQMTGHLALSGECMLLDRQCGAEFLAMMKQLMDMCDQFYAAPVEKYGEMLMCISFVVPLYVRKV